jgi:hypothetical protein
LTQDLDVISLVSGRNHCSSIDSSVGVELEVVEEVEFMLTLALALVVVVIVVVVGSPEKTLKSTKQIRHTRAK